jgi:hypothetical protein
MQFRSDERAGDASTTWLPMDVGLYRYPEAVAGSFVTGPRALLPTGGMNEGGGGVHVMGFMRFMDPLERSERSVFTMTHEKRVIARPISAPRMICFPSL